MQRVFRKSAAGSLVDAGNLLYEPLALPSCAHTAAEQRTRSGAKRGSQARRHRRISQCLVPKLAAFGLHSTSRKSHRGRPPTYSSQGHRVPRQASILVDKRCQRLTERIIQSDQTTEDHRVIFAKLGREGGQSAPGRRQGELRAKGCRCPVSSKHDSRH